MWVHDFFVRNVTVEAYVKTDKLKYSKLDIDPSGTDEIRLSFEDYEEIEILAMSTGNQTGGFKFYLNYPIDNSLSALEIGLIAGGSLAFLGIFVGVVCCIRKR